MSNDPLFRLLDEHKMRLFSLERYYSKFRLTFGDKQFVGTMDEITKQAKEWLEGGAA